MLQMTLNLTASQAPLQLRRMLAVLRLLPKGWRYGEGVPIEENVLERTEQLAYYADEFGLLVSTHPCVNGAVVLSMHGQKRSLEVYVNTDGTYELTIETDHNGKIEYLLEDEEVDLQTVKLAIREAAWNTPVSSTLLNTTQTGIDLSLHASLYRQTAGSLSFILNVPPKSLGRSADISDYSIVT